MLGILNFNFLHCICKAQHFRQRSSPEKTRRHVTFSESFRSGFCDEGEFVLKISSRVFGIPQALASNVDLRSEVQTIFSEWYFWKNLICGKTYGFHYSEPVVQLFLNRVYGLAQTGTTIVQLILKRLTFLFPCESAKEHYVRKKTFNVVRKSLF